MIPFVAWFPLSMFPIFDATILDVANCFNASDDANVGHFDSAKVVGFPFFILDVIHGTKILRARLTKGFVNYLMLTYKLMLSLLCVVRFLRSVILTLSTTFCMITWGLC